MSSFGANPEQKIQFRFYLYRHSTYIIHYEVFKYLHSVLNRFAKRTRTTFLCISRNGTTVSLVRYSDDIS